MDHSFLRAWLVDFVGTRCKATSPLGEPPPNRPDVDLVFLGQAKRTVYVSDNDGEGWLYGFFLDPEELGWNPKLIAVFWDIFHTKLVTGYHYLL